MANPAWPGGSLHPIRVDLCTALAAATAAGAPVAGLQAAMAGRTCCNNQGVCVSTLGVCLSGLRGTLDSK